MMGLISTSPSYGTVVREIMTSSSRLVGSDLVVNKDSSAVLVTSPII